MTSPTESAILARIDSLIERGKQIQAAVTTRTVQHERRFTGGPSTYREYPVPDCQVWRNNFTVLVDAVLSKDSTLWARFEHILSYGSMTALIDEGVTFLTAFREDITLGLLRRAEQRIEAAVTVDYLEMAERLFTENGPDTHRHLAATVIAGAVFEHGLRALAQRHNLAVTADDGKPLMLNGLIDVVKKANVVTELDAKSMRAWAGIRNAAAHGQFTEVTEAKAKELISGVTAFLTAHQ